MKSRNWPAKRWMLEHPGCANTDGHPKDRRAMSTTTLLTPIPLTDAELKLLQTLVYQECGMFFDERRIHFLRDRVQRRLKACQIDTLDRKSTRLNSSH